MKYLLKEGLVSIIPKYHNKDSQVEFYKLMVWAQWRVLEHFANAHMSEYYAPLAGHGNAMR